MSTSEELTVPCQRCGRPGGQVAYGWALLCKRCKDSDDAWYEDDQGVSASAHSLALA